MDNKLIYLIARESESYSPLSFINGYTLLGYYNYLYYVDTAFMQFTNYSGYSPATIDQFLNTTIPCISDETLSATRRFDNQSAIESIWTSCFKDTCRPSLEANLEALSTGIIVGVGWLVLMIATLLTKRVSFHKNKCFGRPGIAIPLNMLDNYENRYGYSASVAMTGYSCLAVIFGSYEFIVGTKGDKEISAMPSYVKVFVKMMLTFLVSSIAIPFLFLQNSKNKILGSVFGLLLSLLWMAVRLFKVTFESVSCVEKYKYDNLSGIKYFTVFGEVPFLICLIFLAVKFGYTIYKTTMERRKSIGLIAMVQNYDDTNWRKEFVFRYVQKIINQKRVDDDEVDGEDEEREFKEKLKIKLKESTYAKNPDFFYSSRLMMGAATSCTVIYVISLVIAMYGYIIFIHDYEDIIGRTGVDYFQNELGVSKETLRDYSYCILVSWWGGLVLAIIMFLFSLANSFTWYRKHVVMLRKGNRSFLPNSVNKGTVEPPALMVASMKFAGFQVAYATWGFIISYLLMFIIMVVITTQIFLPMHTKELSYLLQLLINAWSTIVFTIVIMILQKIAARFCFLVDGDTLAVDNRRAFHVYSYFMFFYNVFLGLASCLLRILYGLIIGVMFLQRLQKSTLPKSYEKRDPGFLAYVGYLLLENQHANPVLQCFVNLMIEHHKEEKSFRSLKRKFNMSILDKDGVSESGSIAYNSDNWQARNREYRKIRMRNKWHLFKMLIQNPSLRKYRAKPKKYASKTLMGALQGLGNIGVARYYIPESKIEGDKNESFVLEDIKSPIEHEQHFQVKNSPGQGSTDVCDNEVKPLINLEDNKKSYQANGVSNMYDNTPSEEDQNNSVIEEETVDKSDCELDEDKINSFIGDTFADSPNSLNDENLLEIGDMKMSHANSQTALFEQQLEEDKQNAESVGINSEPLDSETLQTFDSEEGEKNISNDVRTENLKEDTNKELDKNKINSFIGDTLADSPNSLNDENLLEIGDMKMSHANSQNALIEQQLEEDKQNAESVATNSKPLENDLHTSDINSNPRNLTHESENILVNNENNKNMSLANPSEVGSNNHPRHLAPYVNPVDIESIC